MFPAWLHVLALACLGLGGICALVIMVDEYRYPQHMGVMNVVWPTTALFGSVLTLWGYFRYGRPATSREDARRDRSAPGTAEFQYFAIVPMRNLSPGEGIVAALKADTLSLISWQVGMYGFMAFAQFYLLGHLLGRRAEVNTPEFWFMMQLAMVVGFVTAYPVNWWLVASGIKEKM